MVRYFAEHPNAANILMVVIVLLGLAALPSLNRETFPEIKNRNVQVSVPYPGASPFDVEEGICQALENATDGISFLEEQSCIAKDGIGIFKATMQEAGGMRTFLDDIKSAVDGITTFPDNAEDPVIKQLGRTQPVVSIAITADLTPGELKGLAEYYRTELLKLPHVPMVTISGFSQQTLNVEVEANTLSLYKLSIEDIANLIRRESVDLPAGTIKSTDREYQIRFENSRKTVSDLADLVVLDNKQGGQIRLGELANIKTHFKNQNEHREINGVPAAILKINKNSTDDTLTVFEVVKQFVELENKRLPQSTRLILTEDNASVVEDRLNLLLANGWQGLVLASIALFFFFSWRYTFWVALGLPISFIGGLAVMSVLGITINMISMVALLMAIGILMDDAIVISESIASEYKKSENPIEASVFGVQRVGRGVLSSFATSTLLFGSLLFLKGDMGQVMRVLPMVLLAVLSISLLEAFLILPHHLRHSLAAHKNLTKSRWRIVFEDRFERLRQGVGRLAANAVRVRYLVVGSAIALLMVSIALLPSGILKFKFFPDLEGNILEARILLPQGTPLSKTELVVDNLLVGLQRSLESLAPEPKGELVKNIQIAFGKNIDAGEDGYHVATITLDLLDTERRVNSLNELRRLWMNNYDPVPEALSIQFKEPATGPAGKAISIRLQGDDLDYLARASWELQHWLGGYEGVSNVMDDIRPGKKQFSINLLPGALSSGLTSQAVASQLRTAYQGKKVSDVYINGEAYEINVQLKEGPASALADMQRFPLFNSANEVIPLAAIASVEEAREYSRISRINHVRTVTVSGDIDSNIVNTNEVIRDTTLRFMPELQQKYPGLSYSLEGEVKNSGETNSSILFGFLFGIIGVYLLLSLQFSNYIEPLIVMMNIPLALIGVFWGHLFMGLDLTMPSMIGFVSLAGVVINDSILLVEFVKLRQQEGMAVHDAVVQAVRDRFRAITLTSVTTIAGMLPLLSETSLQAQVLVPLVASIVFGMMSSTVLILIVLPCAYTILEDYMTRKKNANI